MKPHLLRWLVVGSAILAGSILGVLFMLNTVGCVKMKRHQSLDVLRGMATRTPRAKRKGT